MAPAVAVTKVAAGWEDAVAATAVRGKSAVAADATTETAAGWRARAAWVVPRAAAAWVRPREREAGTRAAAMETATGADLAAARRSDR